MFMIDAFIINTVLILFPLFSYFLFSIYFKKSSFKLDQLVFDLAIYTSIYLILSFIEELILIKVVMLTIPLFIAYIKQKPLVIIIVSGVIFAYYYSIGLALGLILFELFGYGGLFILFKPKQFQQTKVLTFFVLIKVIVVSIALYQFNLIIYNYSFVSYIVFLVIYSFVIKLIFSLLKKGEEIKNFHLIKKRLKEQQRFRESLFKVTHEIKNPIAVCRGYLEMLNINNQEHLEKYIPIIKEEIDRSIIMMDNFLGLTKLKVECVPMNIIILLEDVKKVAKALVKEKNVCFKCNYLDSLIFISGDYNRLKQVLVNLLKNAIEAVIKNDGVIQLVLKKYRSKIVLMIIDNGLGMDRETLKKVSLPYFTTKPNGTGLGVRLSAEIIAAHGGTLLYKSKKGKGTTAIISLPWLKINNKDNKGNKDKGSNKNKVV